jgi:predicted DNA-binding mobile mystery protein A
MNIMFRNLRLRQLSNALAPFLGARSVKRPVKGWLRAVREVLNMTLEDVGKSLKTSRKRILDFETAEAQDRITLKSLRRVAAAMDCELIYAIVPKEGTISQLTARRARAREKDAHELAHTKAREDVLAVERSMALENQASSDLDRLIDQETAQRLKR